MGNPDVDFDTLDEARGFAIFMMGMKTNMVTVPIYSAESGKKVGVVQYANKNIGANWMYKNLINGADYLLNRNGSTKSHAVTRKQALDSLFARF